MRILLFCLLLALAQVAQARGLGEINTIINRGTQRGWLWSVAILDSASGKVLYQREALAKLIPASNQKIITLYQALKHLGPDYRPAMEVAYTGTVVNGVLRGDLIIRGNGAIVFTSRFAADDFKKRQGLLTKSVEPLVALLRKSGISSIAGTIRSEGGTVSMNNARYPAAAGLLFNENTVESRVERGVLSTTPPRQEAITFWAHRDGALQRRVQSRRRRRAKDIISVDLNRSSDDYWRIESYDKTSFFNDQLIQYLRKLGVGVTGASFGRGSEKKLGNLAGLSVRELASAILRHSDNLRAEMLYTYLVENGKQKLLEKIGSVDGSGLSHKNSLNAFQIVGALRALRTRWPWSYDELARPGEEGTLRARYSDLPSLRAKTGTVDGALSLSGFLQGDREYTFSILLNNVKQRSAGRAAIGQLLLILQRTGL